MTYTDVFEEIVLTGSEAREFLEMSIDEQNEWAADRSGVDHTIVDSYIADFGMDGSFCRVEVSIWWTEEEAGLVEP